MVVQQPNTLTLASLQIEGVSDLTQTDGLERVRKQFEVNALAPLRVSSTLLPKLKKGSKVIMITSRMGSIADNTSGGMYGYRMSKAALNMGAVSLAHDVKPLGIAVAILHPGMVATDMTARWGGGIAPETSVKGLLSRCDQLTLESSGTFWHMDGQVLPW
eukprot:Colp12_sorted_trinity150504_noHs@25752